MRAATHSATYWDTNIVVGACLTYCVLSIRGFKIMSRVLSCRWACASRECVRARFALWSRDSRDGRAYRRASDPLSPTNMLLLLACLCVPIIIHATQTTCAYLTALYIDYTSEYNTILIERTVFATEEFLSPVPMIQGVFTRY